MDVDMDDDPVAALKAQAKHMEELLKPVDKIEVYLCQDCYIFVEREYRLSSHMMRFPFLMFISVHYDVWGRSPPLTNA